MDGKHMGSEDLASPGTQGFKDWSSKPGKNMPSGNMPSGQREKEMGHDIMIAAHPKEVSVRFSELP